MGSNASSPVTVALGAFDDLIARGLLGLLEDEPSLELVARDLEEHRLASVLSRLRPAVAVLDECRLESPRSVRLLARAHPHTRLVLLAERLSSAEYGQLLAFGAAACISRTTQRRDVVGAIHLAARGMQLAPFELAAGGPRWEELTAREAEILTLLQRGRANAQIASDLHVSVETVRTHVRSVYRKLGVHSRAELRLPAAADGV
jgi:DNA-binding NarL/FixJ family response regulator